MYTVTVCMYIVYFLNIWAVFVYIHNIWAVFVYIHIIMKILCMLQCIYVCLVFSIYTLYIIGCNFMNIILILIYVCIYSVRNT